MLEKCCDYIIIINIIIIVVIGHTFIYVITAMLMLISKLQSNSKQFNSNTIQGFLFTCAVIEEINWMCDEIWINQSKNIFNYCGIPSTDFIDEQHRCEHLLFDHRGNPFTYIQA